MILRGEQQHYISSVRACTAHLILRAACVGLGLAHSKVRGRDVLGLRPETAQLVSGLASAEICVTTSCGHDVGHY